MFGSTNYTCAGVVDTDSTGPRFASESEPAVVVMQLEKGDQGQEVWNSQ